jgi:NADH dehydrogenase
MSAETTSELPHVVIVGAGFAGLKAAAELKGAPVEVTVVDRKNHHLFQPLLYQVATASLGATEVAKPIRDILRDQDNATVLMGEVTAIDPKRRKVFIEDCDSLDYDYLLLATGATHSYFGNDDWAEHAPGLKTIEDALDIRRRVLLAFERAERTSNPAVRRRELTFVVVGAGPTGVELAGALCDIATRTLIRNFRNFDPSDARVLLVEGLDEVLGAYSSEMSQSAKEQLEELGVEVRLNSFVTDVGDGWVEIDDERLECGTVLWGAGVRASGLGSQLNVPLDKMGRVLVTPYLTSPADDRVYVAGDLSALKQNGEWLPGVAQNALQGGAYVGKRIKAQLQGEEVEPYKYKDKGKMATIGRRRAVAETEKLKLDGFFAWLMWAVVHVYFLIGFKNRLFVMLNWINSYIFRRRGARVISWPPDRILPCDELSVDTSLIKDDAKQPAAE